MGKREEGHWEKEGSERIGGGCGEGIGREREVAKDGVKAEDGLKAEDGVKVGEGCLYDVVVISTVL